MQCPFCQDNQSRVVDTTPDNRGGIRRRRECESCSQRFTTYERPLLATPSIVKQDGMVEAFDSQKVLQGIRIACAKRPVSAKAINRLVGEVETELQHLGVEEVPSRKVGDLVIERLKALDHVAYIRYAIVYLRLDDARAIREEINQLMEGSDS